MKMRLSFPAISIFTLAFAAFTVFADASPIPRFHGNDLYARQESIPFGITCRPTHCELVSIHPPNLDLKRGRIFVINSNTGNVVGYVSRRRSIYATYRYEVEEVNSLIVQFHVPKGATSATNVRMTAENSDILDYPVVGLIQGRDSDTFDIARGSSNYLYFGGTFATDEAPALVTNSYSNRTDTPRAAESEVWNIDLETGSLVPQWVNSDNSKPDMELFCQGITLYAGADYQAFTAQFPDPSFPLTLKFSPL